MKFDMCRTKLKGKSGGGGGGRGGRYCRNDGMQELLSCTRSGILQAANADHHAS